MKKLPEISQHKVNWQNGMIVTKENFQELENHFLDLIRDVRTTDSHSWQYGLLPSTGNSNTSLEFSVEPHDNFVYLYSCRGITNGGVRIEINRQNTSEPLKFDLSILKTRYNLESSSAMEFYVVIKGKPYTALGIKGAVRVEEYGVRHPFVSAYNELDIIKDTELNENDPSQFILPIGEIHWRGDRFVKNERFIPPCTSIECNSTLLEEYEQLFIKFKTIEESIKLTIIKIKNGTNTSFLSSLFFLNSDIGNFLAHRLESFRRVNKEKSPMQLLIFVSELVRVLSFALVKSREEEKIKRLISDYTNITQANFEQDIKRVLDFKYNHLQIIEMLDVIKRMVDHLERFFHKLSSTDPSSIRI